MRPASLVRSLAITAACAAALASCITRAASTRPRSALSADAAFRAYYAAPGPVATAEKTLEHEDRAFRVWKASLAPRDVEPAIPAAKQPIRFVWYEPVGDAMDGTVVRGGRRPLVLISPILGSDTDFVEGFAESFARLGWHAAIVKRPKLEYDESRPLSQVEEGMRLSVSRHRQVLDAFLARGDVDPARIGSFGISAGAILNAVVAGADDRYVAHVFALGGGPLADVLLDSEESSLQKLVKKALAHEKTTPERLREDLRALVRSDPIALAPRVRREDVLMVLARSDHAVPTRYQERLWHALGEPETASLPLGHYTAILFLPWVRTRTLEFLRRRFDESVARETRTAGG